MFSLPLALIGVVLALVVTLSPLSVMVLIGLVVLAGIVVNNAIVLVDYTRQLRDQGMEKVEALVEAGSVRLRPILMTTMTTVLGLMPLAIGVGEGAELRAPLAITLMGGLLISTVLTLVVIPVVYATVDRSR
jgi:HAE1 family hydrophobic/amphiphilic exporter-1